MELKVFSVLLVLFFLLCSANPQNMPRSSNVKKCKNNAWLQAKGCNIIIMFWFMRVIVWQPRYALNFGPQVMSYEQDLFMGQKVLYWLRSYTMGWNDICRRNFRWSQFVEILNCCLLNQRIQLTWNDDLNSQLDDILWSKSIFVFAHFLTSVVDQKPNWTFFKSFFNSCNLKRE